MNRNIAKPFVATLSLLDVATDKTNKYKCFHGEDVQLTVNVVGEDGRRVDLSNMSVKIYFTLDKNINEPVYRQDTGIVVDKFGVITVMLEKSYIRIGNNTLKIVLYDEDQTVFLQPLIITCIDPLIGEVADLEIPDDIDVRDELSDIRRIIGDLDSQLDTKVNKEETYVNIKDFGAKGDGFTDDTEIFHDCIEYALSKDKGVFIPNGTYMIDEGFVFANNKQHVNVDKKIMILGESANGVKIEKISPVTTQDDCAFNVCNCKYVQIENISSSTYQPVKYLANGMYFQGFTEWGKELKDKDIILKNCVYTGDEGVQSPYIYINTPAPKSWDRYSDGNYAKYPIQITNNSGYNAIDINNFSINDDGTAGSPADKGAIGVVDYVNNSNAVFFCDMKGRRSFAQYIRTDAEVSSFTKPGCVFEVHHTGHIGIGCSTDENATEAQGWDGIKLRDKSPSIAFFDVNDDNRRASINMAKQAYGEEFNFKIDGKGMSIVLQNDGSVVYNGFRYTPIANGLKLINENTVADGLILGRGNEEQVIYLDKNGVLRLGYTYFTSDLEGARFQYVSGGDTGSRPILTAHWRDIGFQYFDTTLNKPIWWNGTKWVDAIGQNV